MCHIFWKVGVNVPSFLANSGVIIFTVLGEWISVPSFLAKSGGSILRSNLADKCALFFGKIGSYFFTVKFGWYEGRVSVPSFGKIKE